LFHEVYTLLGALAVSTTRIRLGTAVTNPLTRHPSVTAAAFSTLAELSEGRASLGISVGDSALKSMNLEVAKMSVLAETVALCRKLLGGEAVSFGEGKTAQLHHVGPRVPIYVAATGPKMLELAGRLADGVILMNGIAPELIREAVRIVREGERTAVRKEGSVKIAVWAACHPNHQAVKFNVARAILRNIPGQVDDLTRRVAATVKQAYDFRQHGSAASRLRAPHP
jgi:5,10-methylenetetrahydromethanopterin reductase